MHSINKVIHRIKGQLYKKGQEVKRKENKLNFSHITYYAIGNVGDTVLSWCVRKTFQQYFNNSINWNLVDLKTKVTNRFIKNVNKNNAVVIGGGGLFLPDSNKNDISGWQWAISKKQLDEIKTPLFVFCVGYNYFRGQTTNEIFKDNLAYLIKKSSFVGLRNKGSITKINELLKEETLCNKLVFQPCTTTLITKITDIPEKPRTKNIAINIAFDRDNLRYGDQKEKILTKIAASVKLIQSKGYIIYYVAHCDDDLKFTDYLKSLSVPFIVKNLSWCFPLEVFKFYNEMELVIGMRGHSQMIPFGLNCPIISLCSHEKMWYFLNDIGCRDWGIEIVENIESLDQTIIEKFETIYEKNYLLTRNRLIKAQNDLWNITLDNMNYIEKSLSNNR